MEFIGWLSSAILVATIGTQVHKQYKTRSVEGVSKWLFVGQLAASAGFTLYSALVHNWVFVVTNSIMLCNAIAGILIYQRNVRESKRAGKRVSAPTASASSARERGSHPTAAVPSMHR